MQTPWASATWMVQWSEKDNHSECSCISEIWAFGPVLVFHIGSTLSVLYFTLLPPNLKSISSFLKGAHNPLQSSHCLFHS